MSATPTTGERGGNGRIGGITYLANAAPTVDNDVSKGFVAGDRFIDETAKRIYDLMDATQGAANWIGGGGETLLVSSGGSKTYFPASANTNAARGLALQAAKTAAASGDCILVFPGTYDTKNLLKNGVNWFFYPGADVIYTGNADGGLFDDTSAGANGAVSCRIGGSGRFWNHGSKTDGSFPFVVGIANASDIRIECDAIRTTQTPRAGGGIRQNGGILYVRANIIDGGDNQNAIWWSDGACYVSALEITANGPNGAVYSTAGSGTASGALPDGIPDVSYTNTGENFLWVTCQRLNGLATAGDLNARVWITAKEITSVSAGNALSFCCDISGNFVYINAQKITPSNSGITTISNEGTAHAWINVEKLTCGANGINIADSGSLFWIEAMNIEDPNNWATAMVNINDGTSHIRAGHCTAGTMASVVGLYFQGGTCTFSGIIDTSAVSSGQPVKVESNGLTIDDSRLIGGSGIADVITGGTFTVHCNQVRDPNGKGVKNTITVVNDATL